MLQFRQFLLIIQAWCTRNSRGCSTTCVAEYVLPHLRQRYSEQITTISRFCTQIQWRSSFMILMVFISSRRTNDKVWTAIFGRAEFLSTNYSIHINNKQLIQTSVDCLINEYQSFAMAHCEIKKSQAINELWLILHNEIILRYLLNFFVSKR